MPSVLFSYSLVLTSMINVNMYHPRILNFFVLISILFLTACGETDVEVDSITLSQSSAELEIGETLSLKATVSPSNATYNSITWTSSNAAVATVSDSGLVAALSEGSTAITAMVDGKRALCLITVVKGYVAVSSVSLDRENLELFKGEKETLRLTISPDDATDKAITWTSSAPEIVSVSGGTVSALEVGNANIYAKVGDVSAMCSVSVKPVSATGVKITGAKQSVFIKDTLLLSYDFIPEHAELVPMHWATSDESILSVDGSGLCIALSEGTAIVTVSNDDKSLSDSVEIKVIDPYMKVGQAYISKWGFECTVNSIRVSTSGSKMTCFVSYTIKNVTTDSKLTECLFSGITESGESIGQYGFYGYVFPGESTSRSYSFETLSSDPFVKLVFSNPFSNPVVNSNAPDLVWDITRFYD